MNLKKLFYTMKKEEFEEYLVNLKNEPSSVRFFEGRKHSYFFHVDDECMHYILELHKLQQMFDYLMLSLDCRKIDFIVESLIIDEIKTTNATENIYSTRKDIFGLMNQVSSIRDKKVKSILQAYQQIQSKETQITDLNSIRALYDVMMEGDYDSKSDHPDGKIFRKGSVDISDGLKSVHSGFYPEADIIAGMEEFLSVYHNPEEDIYKRLILSHFLFETIHPFYDGNGRFGRLLFSMELLKEENTICAYLISSSINRNKKAYYSALEKARETHTFGCLNTFFAQMSEIFIDGFKNAINHFQNCEAECQRLYKEAEKIKLTKSQRKIVEYLIEASCFSYYGTTNERIISNCGVSKRTVMTAISKLKDAGMLEDTKIGVFDYHKIKDITTKSDTEI